MSENQFKIILEYIKDLSVETPNANTLLSVRKNISSYNLDIDISSMMFKNKSLEVTTRLILQDKGSNEEKSFFDYHTHRHLLGAIGASPHQV